MYAQYVGRLRNFIKILQFEKKSLLKKLRKYETLPKRFEITTKKRLRGCRSHFEVRFSFFTKNTLYEQNFDK